MRQAGSEDVEALFVLNRSVQELHVIHQPDYFKHADPKVRRRLVQLDAGEFGCPRVERGESVPAGYALTILHDRPEQPFRFAHRFCEIDRIAVSPEFRGRGVARALIERVLQDARLHAIEDVELTSW